MRNFGSFVAALSKTNVSRLHKLKVDDLLAFVIKYVPKSYTDNTLADMHTLESIGSQTLYVTVNVEIVDIQMQGFGKNARLVISALMSDACMPLQMTIFHPKPFHKKIFAKEERVCVYGKLERFGTRYFMTQPRRITETNTISMQFKNTLLNAKAMKELIQECITLENLRSCGLPDSINKRIIEIYHPSHEFLCSFEMPNTLPPEHIHALKFVECYRYLALLSRKKPYFKAQHRCANDINPFLQSLPFVLTRGQSEAIESIRADFASSIAARRLIMGDVGCGKTIVILAAVMLCYPHQSMLMTPTTILAKQIFEQALQLLPSYVKVSLITAQSKKHDEMMGSLRAKDSLFAQQDEDMQAHFIIGTQALLYRDFNLKSLALVMSDEQHRFGTNQRYRLEKMALGQDWQNTQNKGSHVLSTRPHVLQFSATPIPRTLAMINTQFIDVSIIRDLPFQKDIRTAIVGKAEFKAMFSHIQDEVKNGRQVLIVYPLVEESERLDYLSLSEGLSFWQKNFDNVFCTSGRDKDKERIIETFAKEGSILLATTLIEVGISLPKVSTIVIVAPERLGLATLHQLRGRVSRNGLKGYCFLYTHHKENERLQAFCKTLSGFEIAELDLKYRNSGDLLSGERQSGDEFIYLDLSKDGAIVEEVKEILKND